MERSHRADHNFAVASIALVIFFLVAGISTWMLGSTATVDPAGSVSQLRTPIDDENTRQYFYALYDLEIEMKAALRSQLGDEILDGKRVEHLQIPAPPPVEPNYSVLLSNVYQGVSIVERIHDRSQKQPGSSDKGVMLHAARCGEHVASRPGQIDGWHRRVESVNGSSTIRWQP